MHMVMKYVCVHAEACMHVCVHMDMKCVCVCMCVCLGNMRVHALACVCMRAYARANAKYMCSGCERVLPYSTISIA